MLRQSHLYPGPHGNRKQSQLGWTDAVSYTRHLSSVFASTPAADQGDTSHQNVVYDERAEAVAHLKAGEVLYLPAFWGQQTFSTYASTQEPAITLSVGFYPAAVFPDARPENRGPWGSTLNPEYPESIKGARQSKAFDQVMEKTIKDVEQGGQVSRHV